MQHLKLRDIQKALVYLKQAEQFAQESHNPYRIQDAARALGIFYQDQKTYIDSEIQYKKALSLAYQNNNAITIRDVSSELAFMYAQSKQCKAYQYQVKVTQLNDSLFSGQAALKTRDLTANFESMKKDQQVKLTVNICLRPS